MATGTTVSPLNARTVDNRLARPRRFWLRRATGPFRCLPDFFLLGEMKCATSSFFNALSKHPQIASPLRKEVHYFTKGYHLGSNWYRSHFPLKFRRNNDGHRSLLTGEATPDYFYFPPAARRIKELVPKARFIILLRNPVERAVSHYHHEVRMGRETLSFEDAVDAEDVRIEEARGTTAEDETRLHASYVDRAGMRQACSAGMTISTRVAFLVLNSSDFEKDSRRELNAAADFLEIAPFGENIEDSRRNAGIYSKPSSPVIDRLNERFAAENSKLCALLGRDFHW